MHTLCYTEMLSNAQKHTYLFTRYFPCQAESACCPHFPSPCIRSKYTFHDAKIPNTVPILHWMSPLSTKSNTIFIYLTLSAYVYVQQVQTIWLLQMPFLSHLLCSFAPATTLELFFNSFNINPFPVYPEISWQLKITTQRLPRKYSQFQKWFLRYRLSREMTLFMTYLL